MFVGWLVSFFLSAIYPPPVGCLPAFSTFYHLKSVMGFWPTDYNRGRINPLTNQTVNQSTSNYAYSTILVVIDVAPHINNVVIVLILNLSTCAVVVYASNAPPATVKTGSYGPGWRAGEAEFPGCVTPLKGLLHCGDSTLPGLGLPAVAASGMSAARSDFFLFFSSRLGNIVCIVFISCSSHLLY